jgi:hypothetical protein
MHSCSQLPKHAGNLIVSIKMAASMMKHKKVVKKASKKAGSKLRKSAPKRKGSKCKGKGSKKK